MRKLFGILLASATVLGSTCFTASVSAEEANVSFAPTQSLIEVEPGQQKVEIKYSYTKNEGWAVMGWHFVADQSVISFNPYDKNGNVASSYKNVVYHIYEKDEYGDPVALVVTPNMYGLSGYNPAKLGTNESYALIECADLTGDTAAAGSDFMSFYVNIADDAAAGDYTFTVTTNNDDKSNNINVSGEKIAVTIDPVTIRVKSTAPAADGRLAVEGAQIRIPDSGGTLPTQGLRFVNTITEELYNTLVKPASSSDTGLGFGTVVFPTKLLAKDEQLTKETVNGSVKAAVVPAVKLYRAPADGVVKFTACMTDITQDAESFQTEYTVVPYATYMDGDTEVTVYGAQYSTSVFKIAAAAYADSRTFEYAKEYLHNTILHVVDPKTYNDPQYSDIYKP